MRYWWVNQKQTFRHEVGGGYLWSPKRNSRGYRNPFYEFMREVSPGDLILSYAFREIRALGVARSYAYEAPKPQEFGTAGAYWSDIGWRVAVKFHELNNPIKPADHMHRLRDKLPKRYSPLRLNGHGQQNMYLTTLPEELCFELVDLIGKEAHELLAALTSTEPSHLVTDGDDEWETKIIDDLTTNPELVPTTREQLINARKGQGLFREALMKIEHSCRLTGIQRPEHLIASHSKPWRVSSNEERLDGANGLLLSPDADHLFDRGFVSFDDGGEALISPVVDRLSLQRMGLDPAFISDPRPFSTNQKKYLDYHRENIFLKASVRDH